MTKDDLTVWGIGTSRTMRVHWMLMEFGLDYEFHPIRSRSGETYTEDFLRLNPKHKIPVLRHGEHVLTESPAILTYLAETFPAPEGFHVPADAPGRARLHEWGYFIMMELDAISLYVIRRHGDLAATYGEAPLAVASAKEYFADLAGAVLNKLPEGFDTLLPEGLSVADLLMSTCLGHAQICGIEIPPPWQSYQQRLTERPAFRRAYERNFPDRPLSGDR